MSTKRKTHSARFKAKVALEAYKGDKTANCRGAPCGYPQIIVMNELACLVY